MRDPFARFWRDVEKADGDCCWLWQGRTNERGYGLLSVGGRDRFAHRISYALHRGAVPEGALVLHSCDTPACVRPDHLCAGDAAENVRDMVSRGRHRNQHKGKSACVHGHPYTPENTFRRRRTGWRECRICMRRQRSRARAPGAMTRAGLDPASLAR